MKRKLSDNAVKSWIVEGIIIFIIIILVFLFVKFGASFLEIDSLTKAVKENERIINIIFILIFAFNIWDVFISPAFSYKQWSYKIDDEEIWFREGIFWTKEVVIPIVRIQNINLRENPISKKFNIADITIGTAGGVHKIPAIDKEEVEKIMEFLKEKINDKVRQEEVEYADE